MVHVDPPEILMEFVAGLILLSITYNHDCVALIVLFLLMSYTFPMQSDYIYRAVDFFPLANDVRVVHWEG
jgi:hypothetical protein